MSRDRNRSVNATRSSEESGKGDYDEAISKMDLMLQKLNRLLLLLPPYCLIWIFYREKIQRRDGPRARRSDHCKALKELPQSGLLHPCPTRD